MLQNLSSYPNGFGLGVEINKIPLVGNMPGRVWWVGSASGGGDGNPGTRQRPLATLAKAISRCVANKGDIIFLMPLHAETISSATALAFNIAGITIIGLGSGTSRPTFTFDTANTTKIVVSVANVSIFNCIFVGNFLSIATCFSLTTAPEFTVDRCCFRDTSATLGFLSIITTTVAVNSDGLTFTRNEVQSDATTTPGPAVVIANTIDRVTVNDNFVTHSVASNNVSALIEHGALVVTHLQCLRNLVYSINTDTATGAILVKTTATTGSGIIAHNRVRALDVAAAIMITAAAIQYGAFDNLYIGDGVQLSGFVLPAIGSDA